MSVQIVAIAKEHLTAYNKSTAFAKAQWIEFPDFTIRYRGLEQFYSDTQDRMLSYYAFEIRSEEATETVMYWLSLHKTIPDATSHGQPTTYFANDKKCTMRVESPFGRVAKHEEGLLNISCGTKTAKQSLL